MSQKLSLASNETGEKTIDNDPLKNNYNRLTTTCLILSVLLQSMSGLFLCLPPREAKAAGTIYYVDNTVTDNHAASGTADCTNYDPASFSCSGGSAAAYKTVADINAGSFSPDDQILFRRGQVWREELVVPSSGTVGHPIVFGAFGVGNNPVLNRTESYTAWWEYSLAPNSGFERHSGTLNDGTGDTFNGWTVSAGAGVTAEAAGPGYVGNSALKLAKPSATSANAMLQSPLTLSAGTAYYLEFYGKRDSGSVDCRIALRNESDGTYLNEDGAWRANADDEGMNPSGLRVTESSWTKKSKSFTTPSGATSYTLQFMVKNDQAATCEWDSLYVIQGSARGGARVWAGYAAASVQTGMLENGVRKDVQGTYTNIDPLTLSAGYFYNHNDDHNFYYRKDAGVPAMTEVGRLRHSIYVMDKSYVTVQNLDAYGPGGSNGQGSSTYTGFWIGGNSNHVIIKDMTISGSGEYGAWSDYMTSYVTYDGIISHDNRDMGLYFNSQGGAIRNCRVYENGNLATDTGDRGGIGIYQGGPEVLQGGEYVVVPVERLNYEPITVEDNIAYGNGAANGMSDSEIIAVAPMRPIYVLRNYTYDCVQSCIMIAGGEEGATGSVVAYNLAEGFGKISFLDARESYGLYAGIRIGGGGGGVADVKIYNNTILNGGGAQAGNYRAGVAVQLPGSSGAKIHNNIFYNNRHMDIAIDDNVPTTGMSISNNIYYRANGDYAGAWNWYEREYDTLSAWQAASGMDAGAAVADPLFANGSGSYSLATDYELRASSPAINAGTFISGGETSDYLGHALSGNPDTGAFELISATPTAAAPSFSPAAGTYSAAQNVVLSSATSDATIHYTTDGTAPTASSPAYSSALSVASSRTIRAIAIKAGYNNSPASSATYTINISSGGSNGGGGTASKPVAGAPSFSHKGGNYGAKISVALTSATSDAAIYYTTDGTTPTASATLYEAPVEIASSKILKAIATRNGYADSPVATASYVIGASAPGSGKSGHPDGTLLKTPDSFKVYVIMSGLKKWISTPEVFEQLGYEWTDIVSVTGEQLAAIGDYEDNLIRTLGDYKVYLVVSGIKRHIPNPEIFLDYGFAWGDVKDVPVETVDRYENAFLLKQSGQEGIFYISGGVRKLIPTTGIFDSYGDRVGDVQIVSKAELESYPVTNLIRLAGSNDVYLIGTDTKQLIPSVAVFEKYKLDWNRIVSVNRTEFDWYRNDVVLK